MDNEPNATGSVPSNPLAGGGESTTAKTGITPSQKLSSAALVDIPAIKETAAQIKALKTSLAELFDKIKSFNSGPEPKRLQNMFFGLADSAAKAAASQTKFGKYVAAQKASDIKPAVKQSVWESENKRNPSETIKLVSATAATSSGGGGGGSSGNGGGGGSKAPASVSGSTNPMDTDRAVTNSKPGAMSSLMDMSGLSLLTAGLSMAGNVAGMGVEYAYNRINGPQGNQNTILRVANALAPNVTMMRAAGAPIRDMEHMIQGLAGKMPIMGTPEDMLNTILAGQSVGALMAGTPGRNGFFESARQMQVLNPGMSPTNIGRSLAGYMGNVQAQQRGMFLGQGAFTMVGQGGRYKTLAEWAEGITKFLEQNRPGGSQGKRFTSEELITQNFPGSNINAWFQMMGVPQDMVDYWWQYVLTNTGGTPASSVTSDVLKGMVDGTRGINLGYERLRNVTQGTRREFLMGSGMYDLYGVRESADRRFNVAMQGADAAMGQFFHNANLGRLFALLPTPIADLLMPLITKFVSSPFGAFSGIMGGLFNSMGGGGGGGINASAGTPPINASAGTRPSGISANAGTRPGGDPPSDHYGYVGDPIGDYGYAGGTSTSHLSPDLASRVNQMLRANPRLKISSGYRDTVTQDKLRRNGYSLVAPASRSKHTRGWAVDIGPTSQGGWLAKNAHRFGLQSAVNQGEPWHIQLAGTMPVGDMPVGDNFLSDIWSGVSSVASGALSAGASLSGKVMNLGQSAISAGSKYLIDAFMWLIQESMSLMTSPIQNLLNGLTKSGTLTSVIDNAISFFVRSLLAPLTGLAGFGGMSEFTDADYMGLINQGGIIPLTAFDKISMTGRTGSSTTLPGLFPSSRGAADSELFGDPVSLMQRAPTTPSNLSIAPTVVNASINITGMSGNQADAKRVAYVIADHLETEMSRRRRLVT